MANDFYQYDNEDNNSYKKMVALCVAAASLVVLAFLVMLYINTEKKNARIKAQLAEEEIVEEDDFLQNSNDFTSQDLDFWKDSISGSNKDREPRVTPTADMQELEEIIGDDDVRDAVEQSDDPSDIKDSEAEDGIIDGLDEYQEGERDNYICIKDDSGNNKYYEIIQNVPKNNYDFDNNLIDKDGVLSYKKDAISGILGIDLSKFNGEIDWKSVKECGVSFAMLRLGSRSYGTGEIVLDEKFVDYAQNAELNSIPIGAYFYSQAINENEAIEEANYIVGAVAGFNVKYPIALDIEKVTNDAARTDSLTAKERTTFAKLFCDTVKNYGYTPIIYADKAMLVTGLNIEELSAYDIWIADYEIPTKYPYEFSMWQYSNKGHVNGITGDVNLNMSFIDYLQKQ